MFGIGEAGELGLGPIAGVKEVYRPRLNHFLRPDKIGVVALAVGGMHCLALTHDGKIYSWGYDDGNADDEGEALNELDGTPNLVEGFPEGTVICITRIAAGDNVSIAVTDTGKIYGWETLELWKVSLDSPKMGTSSLAFEHSASRNANLDSSTSGGSPIGTFTVALMTAIMRFRNA
ncbi:hypothetical protein RUND412_009156 [Rhizina undulata]